MNYLVKVISTQIYKAMRVVKALGYGKDDVQTSYQAAPYGVDSNPIKDMIAVYAATGAKGENVVIGYINKNQVAAVGEYRTFSTDADGALKFYIWQKNDGTCLIGGDVDNMVRYSKLEAAFNQLRSDLNSLVSTFNDHTHPYTDDGSPATTQATATQGTASVADITPAKIEEIKTM